jgi:ATP-dependent RNA helicase MSS116, mitochondrial
MMRTSLLRPASICRVARAAVVPARSQFLARGLLRVPQVLASKQSHPFTVRTYSSEATTEATAATPEPTDSDNVGRPGQLTKFADLRSLGVHDALVSAVVDGMKYEDMTEVQSLTVAPALSGKDLYEHYLPKRLISSRLLTCLQRCPGQNRYRQDAGFPVANHSEHPSEEPRPRH